MRWAVLCENSSPQWFPIKSHYRCTHQTQMMHRPGGGALEQLCKHPGPRHGQLKGQEAELSAVGGSHSADEGGIASLRAAWV